MQRTVCAWVKGSGCGALFNPFHIWDLPQPLSRACMQHVAHKCCHPQHCCSSWITASPPLQKAQNTAKGPALHLAVCNTEDTNTKHRKDTEHRQSTDRTQDKHRAEQTVPHCTSPCVTRKIHTQNTEKTQNTDQTQTEHRTEQKVLHCTSPCVRL